MDLCKVHSRYGAPMGRMTTHDVLEGETLGKFELARVRLNNGGYDDGGAYWGHGEPIYRARAFVDYTGKEGRGGMVEWFLRASDREQAKAHVRKRYPNARFFR